MEDILTDLEKGLSSQLSSLTDSIRKGEEQLIRNKEGFLKVQGALEILAVIKQRQVELEDKSLKDALSTAGVD